MDLSSGKLSDPCGVSWLEASRAEKEQAHPGMHNAVIPSNITKTCFAVNLICREILQALETVPTVQ